MHSMRRHGLTPFELQNGAKLDAHKVLHDVENSLFVSCAAHNIAVAFVARDNDQTKGFDFLPKGFVVHRLKPRYNVVSIFKFHREMILPDRILQAQILRVSGWLMR